MRVRWVFAFLVLLLAACMGDAATDTTTIAPATNSEATTTTSSTSATTAPTTTTGTPVSTTSPADTVTSLLEEFYNVAETIGEPALQDAIQTWTSNLEPQIPDLHVLKEGCPEARQSGSDVFRLFGEAAKQGVQMSREAYEQGVSETLSSAQDWKVSVVTQSAFEALDAAADGAMQGIDLAIDANDCDPVNSSLDLLDHAHDCVFAPVILPPDGPPEGCP